MEDIVSGYAKRGFDKYICDEKSLFYKIIKKEIIPVLPKRYEFSQIYFYLEKYYPFELRAFQFQLNGYMHQDKTLKRARGKSRYNVKTPQEYIAQSAVNNLLKDKYISERAKTFDEKQQLVALGDFEKKRSAKIEKMKMKVSLAQEKAQSVEPIFMDKLLGMYDRKNASQKDRVYILHEIYKYDCPKITNFLQRILVHEQNFQLHEMAMKHLQDYGYTPKLRGKDTIPFNTKSKKKKAEIRAYRNLRFAIEGIPEELSYQINNSKIQGVKSYDYFISHSCKDHDIVQKIIDNLNENRINVYCDWISDADYLKRNLVCEATLEVIENRILESKQVLFLDSEESRKSKWVAYELKFALEHGKPIMQVFKSEATNKDLKIDVLCDKWYLDIKTDNLI